MENYDSNDATLVSGTATHRESNAGTNDDIHHMDQPGKRDTSVRTDLEPD